MFEKNAPPYSAIRDCGKIKEFPIKQEEKPLSLFISV